MTYSGEQGRCKVGFNDSIEDEKTETEKYNITIVVICFRFNDRVEDERTKTCFHQQSSHLRELERFYDFLRDEKNENPC